MQTGLDRSLGQTGDLGRLLSGKPLHIAQHKHCLLLLFQLANGRLDNLLSFFFKHLIFAFSNPTNRRLL